jgi:hypothetical protein
MLRQSFDLIQRKYQGIKKGNIRLTQSELIFIKEIDVATTNYRFNVLENEGTARPEEIRLNINDEFVITHLAYYLACTLTDEGVKYPRLEFYTYPLFEIFGQEGITLLPAWQGYFKIDVNNVNFVDKWSLKKHQEYPEYQFRDWDAAKIIGHHPTIDYKTDGIYPVTPMVTLSGAKKNDLNIILPNALTKPKGLWIPDINGEKITIEATHLVVMCRGMLAQNGAKFQN